MKKKILIFSHAMEIGGAERALLGLLENLDYKKYEVDMFFMRHSGELFKYIPKQVNVLPEILEYTCLEVPIDYVIKKKKLSIILGRVIGKILSKIRVCQLRLPIDNGVALDYSHKCTKRFMPIISNKQYDLAISFLTPHYFVQEKVKAKKKIAWIHTDYSKVAVDISSELKIWSKYDKIISISEDVTKSFLKIFPSLEKKIVLIENMMAIDSIKKQSKEFDASIEMPQDGNIKLLSIGRFCHQKNFDNIPNICNRLIGLGCNIKWYIIGFGSDYELIRKKINEENMEDYVIILGKKENPYPYIKECDIYIQPSRYEGNAVTVHEAQLLKKSVIITKYPTASTQLEDGINGYIVPMDNEGCANKINEYIKNKKYLEGCTYIDNSILGVNKLYEIIESGEM